MVRGESVAAAPDPAVLEGVRLAPYQAHAALDWLATDPDSRSRTVDGTLVFGDVSGFTPLTERLARQGKVGAEELTDILNQVFGRLLTVAGEAGGDLLKFGGDALLLLFTGPHHAARAAGCASDLLTALRPFRRFRAGGGWVRLTMSVGLESGPVHLLLVGDTHRELFAVGPVVSATVGLENAADGGEVLVGPMAAAALESSLLVESSEALRLVGRPTVQSRPRPAPSTDGAPQCLPAVLREHLSAGREDGEHRIASLAFLQFRGTDDLLAREGLSRVAAEVEAVVAAAQAACTRHGVTFLATDVDVDGGKILFVAGAPRVGDRDEDRMLLALRESVAVDTVLTVRAGANRGRAFAVDVGTDERRTYAVMGDATNLAARVMGKAGPGEVLATRALLDQAKGDYEQSPREPFQVKGKSQPVSAAVVGAARGLRRADGLRLPFVGRSQERTVLSRALEAARAGAGQVVEVIGEAGLGKSRLADELVAEAADYFVLRVEGGQYAAVTPYAALNRSLRTLVGARPDDEDDVVADRLRATAADVAPEALPWLPLLGPLLGVELPDTPEVAALAPNFRRSARHLHAGQVLAGALHERTLVLVEDAHWLDEATGELLDALCELASRRRWMVCVTRRPDTRGWWPRAEQCTAAVELAPLSDAESADLLSMVAQDRPLPPSTRAALVTRCAGNPLFLRELLDALGDTTAAGDVALLPDTLEEVVGSAVDQLPRRDRELLRVAAVVGARIDAPTLARITDLPEPDVRRSLDRLGRFLVGDGDETFRFAQALVRDVAYEGLPFRRRRDLHGRAGDMLLLRLSEHESTLDLLALHYRAAERHAQAWWYAREAAERARRNSAPVEAARYYRWALDAARHLPDLPASERAEVGERLGDMLEIDGRYDEAGAAFRAARRLLELDALASAGLMKKEGWVRERSGRYSSALGWYTRARRALEGVDGEEAARARAALTMSYGAARARQGRYADSVPHLEQAAADAERLGDLSTLAHCYYLLDWALTDLGRPEAALYRGKALPIYEELGDLVGQASVLNNLGIDAYYEGQWDLARHYYERSREVSRRSGNVVMDGTSLNNVGEILSDQGRLDEAEAVFREALALWRAVRFPVGLALCLSNLGRVASRNGRPEEAADRYAEAREHFTRIGADAFLVEVDSREAERLALAGQGERASAVADETAARAEALGGMPVVLAMLDRVAGVAKAQTGDVAGALRRLRSSRDRATEAKADFELGLTLHEWSRVAALDGEGETELLALSASTILRPMGVQRVAEAPLPLASRSPSG